MKNSAREIQDIEEKFTNTQQETASTTDDRSSHKNNGKPVLDVHVSKSARQDPGPNIDIGVGNAVLENSDDNLKHNTVLRLLEWNITIAALKELATKLEVLSVSNKKFQ